MAFLIHYTKDGHVAPWQYMVAKAGDYKVGQALYNDGSLQPVSATAGKDTAKGKHYICMQEKTVVEDGDILGVVSTDELIAWQTTLAEDGTLTPGTAYCLSDDGLEVGITSTDGCFTVIDVEGETAGSIVTGILV